MKLCLCNSCEARRFARWSKRARAAKTERSVNGLICHILETLSVRQPRGIAVELCGIVAKLGEYADGDCWSDMTRDEVAFHLGEMAHIEREGIKLNGPDACLLLEPARG